MRKEYYFRYGGLPKIYEFGATSKYIGYGDKTTLNWRIEDADSAEIWPAIGSVDPREGSIVVAPCSTIEYKLRARNRDGSATSSEKVNVRKLAVSSPKKGDVWIKGNSYNVRWNPGKNRNIEASIGLMRAPYRTVLDIKYVPNTGSCRYEIPENKSPGDDYKIAITLMDNGCNPRLDSDVFSISESFTDLRIKNCDLMKEIFFKGDTATIRFRYYNDGNQPINAVKVKVQSLIKIGRIMILKKSYNEKIINYRLNSGKNYRFQLTIYPEPGTLKDDKTASNNFCYTETFLVGLRKLIRK